MKQVLFIVLAILAATSNANSFVEQITKVSLIDLLIKYADKNDDGKITEEEVKVAIPIPGVPVESIIKKLDKDNDNSVDRKDLESSAKRFVGLFLGMADFDDNGYVTEKEINSFSCFNSTACKTSIKGTVQLITFLFDLADLNSDGTLSDADYPTLPLPIFKEPTNLEETNQIPKLLLLMRQTIDANKDYQLSKTEVTHFFTTAMNKMDKNTDGSLTLQEIFETMKEFKFPEMLINVIKQQYSNPKIAQSTGNVLKIIFKEVDTNKDGNINADELSTLLTKPISSTLITSIKAAYTDMATSVPSNARPQNMNEMNMEKEKEAAVSAISSFLKEPEFVCCSASSLNNCILSFFLVLILHVLRS